MARILVIEDELTNREVLREMLHTRGHEVTEALDGEEGLRLFRQEQADLVITDIFMPRRDGLGVIRELRKDYPRVKIIAVGAGGQELLLKAKELGANRILEKPLRMKALLEVVRELLEEA